MVGSLVAGSLVAVSLVAGFLAVGSLVVGFLNDLVAFVAVSDFGFGGVEENARSIAWHELKIVHLFCVLLFSS